MNFFKKIFDHEYKELERFKSIADKIEALDSKYSKMKDEELKNQTNIFTTTFLTFSELPQIFICGL